MDVALSVLWSDIKVLGVYARHQVPRGERTRRDDRRTDVYDEKRLQKQKNRSYTRLAVCFVCGDRILWHRRYDSGKLDNGSTFKHLLSSFVALGSDHHRTRARHHRGRYQDDIKGVAGCGSFDGSILYHCRTYSDRDQL